MKHRMAFFAMNMGGAIIAIALYLLLLSGSADATGRHSSKDFDTLSAADNNSPFEVATPDGMAVHAYTISLMPMSVCVSGGAVSDISLAGLISDCETLLASRDTLAGSATLDWSENTSIEQWEGVTVSGTTNRVTELNLRERGLSGEMPPALGDLANLTQLDLSHNQLTGEIPAELGNLANLTVLMLMENQLTGGIPSELGSLSNLLVLFLYGNGLAGEIPTELGDLPKLDRLSLASNRLTGEIPPELGSLATLRVLFLSGNQLSGGIPAELGDLADLVSLSLSSNRLTGQIPAELGDLANLQWLNLSANELTGEIPSELGSLSKLQRLFLSGNRLTGCIPGGLRGLADNDPGNDPDDDLDRVGLPFCEVLLSTLTISPGSLIPAFDQYRICYSASVGFAPVTVTLAATNDHGANLVYLDENNIEIVDADAALEGLQVEFGSGVASIKIRLTSEDRQATHTYTVTDLGNRYDADSSGAIEKGEVIEAINDYLFGTGPSVISKGAVIEVINLYLFG